MNILQRITRQRTQVVLREPFFGRLILRLDMREDKNCPTFWTDGKYIGFNPDYADKLTDDELRGILVHEVMHCANLHPYRREGRNMAKWNVAADLAINGLILKSGFSLPQGGLVDDELTGEAAERIYNKLPDQQDSQGKGGQGALDEVRDAKPEQGDSQESGSEGEEGWREAVVQAANIERGRVPAGFERMVQRVRRGQVDWRSLLRQFLNQVRRSDYSWSRPSRRHLSQGLILPSMRSIECGTIVFAIDTSGSMDRAILDKVWSECLSALEDIRPEAYIVPCDTEVQAAHVVHVEAGDELGTLNLPGGGGTDFRPVFDYLERENIEPSVMLYFTDLCGEFPKEGPPYPVMWITDYDRSSAPFGLTLAVLS